MLEDFRLGFQVRLSKLTLWSRGDSRAININIYMLPSRTVMAKNSQALRLNFDLRFSLHFSLFLMPSFGIVTDKKNRPSFICLVITQ